jgi:hypothetical protein
LEINSNSSLGCLREQSFVAGTAPPPPQPPPRHQKSVLRALEGGTLDPDPDPDWDPVARRSCEDCRHRSLDGLPSVSVERSRERRRKTDYLLPTGREQVADHRLWSLSGPLRSLGSTGIFTSHATSTYLLITLRLRRFRDGIASNLTHMELADLDQLLDHFNGGWW